MSKHTENNGYDSGAVISEELIKFQTICIPGVAYHDCTFIGDELVFFNKPEDGPATWVDTETWKITQKTDVDFVESSGRDLEMKSVDYKYDKLLVGSGRAIKYEESDYSEQGAKLYVFYDAPEWRESAETVNFSTCGDYDVIDVSDLGYKVYGFWDYQNEDQIFVSCNLFSDIFQIKLGQGVEQYDQGTYCAAEPEQYNGTYQVLDHWHREGGLGEWAAHGGQMYDGKLYLATNDLSKCTVYECVLGDDGSLCFKALNFERRTFGRTLDYSYIDGMAIRDGILYAHPLFKDDKDNDGSIIVADLEGY